jgi:hypothetical protein
MWWNQLGILKVKRNIGRALYHVGMEITEPSITCPSILDRQTLNNLSDRMDVALQPRHVQRNLQASNGN